MCVCLCVCIPGIPTIIATKCPYKDRNVRVI